ncbi:O-antigen translocase [Aeromonas caviae]|uniref:LPS biosynthesis protein n=1 Tax=Aeromonas caviae TaxID=648 RepID=A0AA37CXP0_AERCA|nr:O-antigen translocase [Aeromonas caviae]MDH0351905.1 O-antigen translocase [Aeromonas caviae]GJA18764.1 LPS biosynthesis protein [Aeromonas caviae]GJA27422.1 LPS biosynthesis protein [Aeromonas caviae]GJA63046.1 LPS biosynthesis protein [Aeromonas caviae]GJA74156.1 LPS biosynthesis protein [Aeromonas caviae]
MKRLLKVTAMTGLLTLLRMAMGFVIAKVVAIHTGPTGLAMLGQVQSLVASLNGIISAPVGNGVVRFTAEYQAEGIEACSPWWRAAWQWVLILSAIIIPLSLCLSEILSAWLFKNSSLSWVVVVTVLILPLSAISTFFNSIINGLQQYRRFVGLSMLSVLLSSALMLAMISIYNIEGALLAAATQSALIGIVMLCANIRQPWFKLCYWWGRVDEKARNDIRNYILMAITSALTVPTSIILIRNIITGQLGWDAAGQWQAVWKISEVYLGVVTTALGTYYLPKLSSLKNVNLISREVNKTACVIIPVVIFIAVCIYLLRDVVISLLFTEAFKNARELFAVQLTGDVVKIIAWLYAYPMLSRGATSWYVGSEILFSFLFVFLSYALINDMGLIGVNISYLVTYSSYLLFVSILFKKITL